MINASRQLASFRLAANRVIGQRGTIVLLMVFAFAGDSAAQTAAIDFGRDVRPILAKHCFKCHGPDPETREAGLRLDTQQGATSDLGGYAAVVPGDAQQSEMFIRAASEDQDIRMPPADAAPPLNAGEIDVLRRWIEQGGQYSTHWALLPPQGVNVPDVGDANWCRGSIDRFVLREMETADLHPARETGREQLIRRLYLDLTGTTPAPDEVTRFVKDTHPLAIQKLIDRLLASPEYGERFARSWLDLARYSDTNGYEKDRPRSIWPYRDWVIGALNDDMPYDQFSIEQLAGDMLPDADISQRIATGFHRNTMLNEEGGIDPQEYRFYALVDRVATTSTVWMGMTVGCAQCHTHKYDPITHTDYYALMALLNQADEPDLVVTDEARDSVIRQAEHDIDEAAMTLVRQHLPTLQEFRRGEPDGKAVADAFRGWFQSQSQQSRSWHRLLPTTMSSTMPKLVILDDDSILASGDVTKRDVYRLSFPIEQSDVGATALRLEVLPHPSLPAGGPGMAFYEGRRGDFFLSELKVRFNDQAINLKDASHSFGKISVGSGSADAANVIDRDGSTGWSTSGAEGEANQLVVNFVEPLPTTGTIEVELLFERHFAAALGRFRLSLTSGPPALASRLPVEWESWLVGMTADGISEPHYSLLQKHFALHSEVLAGERTHIESINASIADDVRTLGMQQRSPDDVRATFRHHRGEYLQPREQVESGIPAVLSGPNDRPVRDRLELARWLVSDANPLVGRVAVNRAWREFFGVGIVDTAGDFGTQSRPPSHPELLDSLAVEFADQEWSLKRLHRRIVMSATYRQSIGPAPPNDPENQLLSVFPLRRIHAEQIRDSFLSASRLLTHRIGGPSVFPPQPASVMQLAYGSPDWKTSQGSDRYRRSIYTFSKRTAPFAAFATFDGPTGETCLARRDRSTTPLQALTLLNDEMYLEIARSLAQLTLRESLPDASPESIARLMFRHLLVRTPADPEVEAIVAFFHSLTPDEDRWMLVARALMNTDEAVTCP